MFDSGLGPVQRSGYGNAVPGGPSRPNAATTATDKTTAVAARALSAGGPAKASGQSWSHSDVANGCIAMGVWAVSVAVIVGSALGIQQLLSFNNK